jgi:Ser/Thr protein kinase RdoA (MazF antagonist)
LNNSTVIKAAGQFLVSSTAITVELLGNGLIHQTFKAKNSIDEKAIVLQAINTNVFRSPEDIVINYQQIYEHLQQNNNGISIPVPVPSSEHQLLWKDEENNNWRATAFISHSYSPIVADDEKAAYTVAESFAAFTHSLATIDTKKLKEIIPDFHNLSFRHHQFENAVSIAPQNLLLKSTHIIAELRQRKKLVCFYECIKNCADYPTRVMHHDCKISNILFDKQTNEVICPVDLDTVMPGKFFSDLGDMIRSMACTVDENSTAWEEINIRPVFYKAILDGYLEGISNIFTEEEKKNIHYAGLMLVYMQALRFLTDFLQGDIYYKTNYPEQNLNRALNQLILLERLEEFLEKGYSFSAYR